MKPAVGKARELRKNPTDAERFLWQHIRLRQVNGDRFRRQRPAGPYILDFVCIEKKIAVEVDGGQHGEQEIHDRRRDDWLREQGFIVLRFWNHEVLTQIDAVKEVIYKTLKETPSFFLPRERGRKKEFCASSISRGRNSWSTHKYESHLKPHRSRRQLGSGQ